VDILFNEDLERMVGDVANTLLWRDAWLEGVHCVTSFDTFLIHQRIN